MQNISINMKTFVFGAFYRKTWPSAPSIHLYGDKHRQRSGDTNREPTEDER